MLTLKTLLAGAGVAQRELAERLGWSRPSLNQLLVHGRWPKQADREDSKRAILNYLAERGLATDGAFKKVAEARCNAPQPSATPVEGVTPAGITEDSEMLRRKEQLTPAARRHFGMTGDPFVDPQSIEAVYLSAAGREAYDAIIGQALAGVGLLALIGESGSGKTTVKDTAVAYLLAHEKHVSVMQPYVQGMEETDTKGKTLKAGHIAETILRTLTPLAPLKSSPEARFNQVHQALRASSRNGGRHVLIIEEAHCLPTPTLKHLKRFMELKDGLKSLVGIVLIGQPELATRLDPKHEEVREVSQRCVDVPLPALARPEMRAFLEQRLGSVDRVFEPGAVDALFDRLTYAFPLAVQNWVALAMNTAVRLTAPKVTVEIIKELK
ncbi:MAG: AAA family ATPase [Pseudomonadota bacterium]|nr:AAA family ATPase [Pseudomonadota bacterium]